MSSEDYFKYLTQISWKGKWYRRYVVYPAIKKFTVGRTLDVGCGTGLFLEYEPQAVGVDVNDNCIQYCKSRGLESYLMEYDILPFDGHSFDTVILDNVIEHIEKQKTLLNDCYRVL